MELNVRLEHLQGDFRLCANFACEAKLLSVHGASGAGKTTLLRLLAGLMRPRHGHISLAGRLLTDTSKGIFVAPHRRRIGYVVQERLLFPHLNVQRNLDYGRHESVTANGFAELLALLDIQQLLLRAPTTLSVGEQQRVAIGRAFLSCPDILLLDEPLAALDDRRKQELLPYLARLRDNYRLPMIYVSHDRREIEQLADAEVHFECGQQQGACRRLAPRLIPQEARCAS